LRGLLKSSATVLLLVVAACDSANKDVVAYCDQNQARASDALTYWKTAQVVRDVSRQERSTATVIVEDARWTVIPHDVKATIAISAYCGIKGPSGQGFVFVKGYRDGATKMTVSDGHLSSR